MSAIFDDGPFNLYADHGPLIVRVCAAMMCCSCLGTFGRFLARMLMRQPILWDDWMILPALLFSWTHGIVPIIGVYNANFGRHAQFATPETTIRFFKLLYTLELMYPFAIASIKLSIILFYWRIFRVPKTVKPLLAVTIITIVWFFGVLLPGIFGCTPVHSFWDVSIPRTCINSLHYFLGVAIPNVATDIILLLLPIPWIWELVISRSQKIALSGIFLLGGFVIVISTLRMVTLVQIQGQMDFTWSLVPLAIWNVIETNVGVFLACLPSMRPLLRILLGQKLESVHSKPVRLGSVERTRVPKGHAILIGEDSL